MKEKFLHFWKALKSTVLGFGASPAFRDSASVAYFAIFSIPGLIIIVLWLSSLFIDPTVLQEEINRQLSGTVNPEVAKNLEKIIENARINADNWFAKALGVGTIIFGATTIFFRIQQTLNEIWNVEPQPKKAFVKFLKDRANSLGLVVIIGFLLLITTLLSSIIAFANNWIVHNYGLEIYSFLEIGNFLISFVVSVVLFALIFKLLPDVIIPWKSVWIGAIGTATLFAVGKYLLGLYFNTFQPTSAFGAAGSVLLLMMWMNYTCLILFFGAQFTREYARINNHEITPAKHAGWDAEKRLNYLKSKQEEEEALV